MKLHEIVRKVTHQEAVNLVATGSKNIVAILDGECYFVDSYNIFDKDDIVYYFIDYQQLDVIKLIDHLRSRGDGYEDVAKRLHEKDDFTSMKSTKYFI